MTDPASYSRRPTVKQTITALYDGRAIHPDEPCGPPDWSERVDYYMGHDMSRYSDNPDLRQDDLKNEHG